METKKGYVDSFVAFIDILGFKDYITKNKDFESVNKLFCDIADIREEALRDFNIPQEETLDTLTINIISDSIVISISKTEIYSLMKLILIVNTFVFTILSNHKLLCRGAITEGDFYAEKNIAFGPAFVEAYMLENKTAIYPRIIFTRNTLNSYLKTSKATDTNLNNILNIFISLDLKDDLFYTDYIKLNLHDTSFLVNKGCMTSEEASLIFASIRNTIEDELSRKTDSHIREKYLYLKNYYNDSILSVKKLLPFPIPFKYDYVFGKDYLEELNIYKLQNQNNITQNYSNNTISNSNNIAFGENSTVKNGK